MEQADAATERKPLTLDEEINDMADYSPKLAELLRKVAKWHA